MNARTICTACGTRKGEGAALIDGKNSPVCSKCIGLALRRVADTYGKPHGIAEARSAPATTARCFMCDAAIVSSGFVAYRHPYCFCGECLVSTLALMPFLQHRCLDRHAPYPSPTIAG